MPEHDEPTPAMDSSNPKTFFTGQRQPCERGRVFVAMPFEAPHSKELWDLIDNTCKIYGFSAHRGDRLGKPNRITEDILEEIKRAEIVIADLTGRNANVLYELGMAHLLCDAVILVAHEGENLPFDLQEFRCIFFDLTPRGRGHFSSTLGGTLESIREAAPPVVIEDRLQRTREIVNDLKALRKHAPGSLKKEAVWYSGFLSSFAIGPGSEYDDVEDNFKNALQEEKQALLDLARGGCQMYCIISPPGQDLIVDRAKFAKARLEHLLEFLQGDDPALDNIFWATSPYRQKNMHIIGRLACYEGFTKPPQPGYGLTLRQSSPDAIAANIALYETLFKTLAHHMHNQSHLDNKAADEITWLREATIEALKTSLAICNERLP